MIRKSMIALALALVVGGVAPASAGEDSHPLPRWTQRPCAEEDSVNCYWDAGSMGNHVGHSFIVRKVPGQKGLVCVFYTQPKFAKKHDRCFR